MNILRMTAAILLAAVLGLSAPLAGQAAGETPSPSTSGPATPAAKPTTASSRGGEVIALGEAPIFQDPGNSGELLGLASPGELYQVLGKTPTPYSPDDVDYRIRSDRGVGYLSGSKAAFIPEEGLTFDRTVRVVDPSSKKDRLGMVADNMGLSDLAVRAYPARDAEVIRMAVPGDVLQATSPITGETTLYAKSLWVAVEIASGQYGWLRAEGTVPDDGMVTEAGPAATESPEAASGPSVEPSPVATAITMVTASATAEQTSRPGALVAAKDAVAGSVASQIPIVGALAGVILAVVVWISLAARRRRSEADRAADACSKLDGADQDVPEINENHRGSRVEAPARETTPATLHEDVDWDEEG